MISHANVGGLIKSRRYNVIGLISGTRTSEPETPHD